MAHGRIWAVGREVFIAVVNNSSTKKEILIKLGLRAAGGNFKTLTTRLKKEELLSGLELRTKKYLIEHNNKMFSKRTIPLENILIDGSSYSGNRIKKRLIRAGKLKNECVFCGVGPEWNGKTLILQLDHINGKHSDNRLENLRILCPNCHSQTETYVGRAMLGKRNVSDNNLKSKCSKCGNPASKKSRSGLCKICYNFRRRKTERPEKVQLKLFVENYGYREAGRKYGVSDNSIRKWINK